MTTKTNFDRTKAAIQRYERFRLRWEREFERNTNGSLHARALAHGLPDANTFVLGHFRYMMGIQRRIVGAAFIADTDAYNNETAVFDCLFPMNAYRSEVDAFILHVVSK